MVQTVLSLIQVFQKMLETKIKYEILREIYKEPLREQYWSDLRELIKSLSKDKSHRTVLYFIIPLSYSRFKELVK